MFISENNIMLYDNKTTIGRPALIRATLFETINFTRQTRYIFIYIFIYYKIYVFTWIYRVSEKKAVILIFNL